MATTTIDNPPSVLDRPLASALALTWEKVLYLVLIAAAFVTRFYDLGARVMSHDESLHTQYAWYLYEGRGFQHTPLMHGPLKFELSAFFYWLLGDSDFTARIPTALMGVAAVGLMWYFRKWLGRAGALAAALLMLISPYMLYYSRYIRDEPYVVVWGLLTALCTINYMETRAARYLYWLTAVTALFYATMEASFIYIAITMLFLGLHVVRELFAVRWPQLEFRRPFQIAFAVTLAALVVMVGFILLERQGTEASGAVTAVPADPNAPLTTGAASPYAQTIVIAGVVAALGLVAGVYFVLRSFGDELRRFPVLDLLMIFGLFVLPQLTAFPVLALGKNPNVYTPPALPFVPLAPEAGLFERLGNAFQNLGVILGNLPAFLGSDMGTTSFVLIVLIAVSAAIGWWWDWRKFLICAGIFYGIYIPLFTTFFTNGGGIATGLVGSLGYWLEQHGVKRGNQPVYYYALINLPVYEFLPAIGALFAAGLGLFRWFPGKDKEQATPVSPSDTLGFPVIAYFGFWAIGSLVAFSIAGEKMPWLTVHITLPLILLSGWAIGTFIDATDWQAFRERRAWLVAVLLPITVTALAAAVGTLLGANPPAAGSELPQLQATGAFVSAVLVTLIGGAGIYVLGRDLGWGNVGRLAVLGVFGLLALLTARASFIASFVNYDSANEFLVYAHGARGVKTVLEQIDDIQARTTDGLGLKVAYDSDVAWPMSWYFREYDKHNYAFYGSQPTRDALDAPVVIAGPKDRERVERLLGSNYYKFEYIRMVWPMQEYFNLVTTNDNGTPGDTRDDSLNWDRIRTALTDKDYRQAIWNIWWNRDYTLYGELTNVNYDLSQWPVAERMWFYVRKDVAAQIWDYGVGPTALAGEAQEDPYEKSRQAIPAVAVWGARGVNPGFFDGPRSVAVAPDGSIYVTDSRNHRVQKFDAQGQPLLTWGSFGALDQGAGAPGQFNEPWGIAVGPDGSVYVADLWNHRIQKFDEDGNFVKMWGYFGQDGSFEAFYGPRGVVVDEQGRLFVSDTGNDRIVVFDQDGNGLLTIGSTGFDPGLLDEPVGVGLGSNGELYVADTWNMRVQVYRPDPATGEYLFAREWTIFGWFGQSIDNKPYLAVDQQDRVYVTDPEGYRVIVFDQNGAFVATWGQYGNDTTTFTLPNGIALDSEGQVYVTDDGGEDGNQRLIVFPPVK